MKDIDLIIESLKDKTEEEITLMLKECFGEKIHNILLLQKAKLLIFLDIDGVLNTITTYKEQENLICSKLVSKFNNFLENKDISIVISSSWRHDMEELEKQLEKAGFKYWHKVTGKTPSYSHLFHSGEQIRRWINDNPTNAEILIVDDDIHDITPYFPDSMIIKTDMKVGLTDGNIKKMKDVYSSYSLKVELREWRELMDSLD